MPMRKTPKCHLKLSWPDLDNPLCEGSTCAAWVDDRVSADAKLTNYGRCGLVRTTTLIPAWRDPQNPKDD